MRGQQELAEWLALHGGPKKVSRNELARRTGSDPSLIRAWLTDTNPQTVKAHLLELATSTNADGRLVKPVAAELWLESQMGTKDRKCRDELNRRIAAAKAEQLATRNREIMRAVVAQGAETIEAARRLVDETGPEGADWAALYAQMELRALGMSAKLMARAGTPEEVRKAKIANAVMSAKLMARGARGAPDEEDQGG